MKLAIMMAALLAALPATAGAEILHPPSGPVYEDGPAADPVEPQLDPVRHRGAQRPDRQAKRGRLRGALMEQFDVNGDGKLGPRERQRAIRVLQRLEQRLAGQGQGQRQGQRQGRPGKMRRFIERNDANGDGNVGPREVPRGAANRMRRFDRNSDGWVSPGELPQ